MSRYAETPREALRLRVTGVVHLLVLLGLVASSIAIYAKVFSDHVTVELRTREAGLQLNVGGDVRMNGAIVGRIAGVEPGSPGARVTLQVDTDAAAQIPADVTGRIVPTTLFGQKLVELRSSDDPVGGSLRDGDVIAEDTSAESVEVAEVLDDLQPLLTAVEPARLSSTLGALATGLDGRGERLGRLLADGGAYLEELNALTPAFERDLALLRDVSGDYAALAPDALSLLDSLTVTSRTITAREGDLGTSIDSGRRVSDAGADFLRANRSRLAESARLARPTAELLAEYSPEIECVLDGFLAVAAQTRTQIEGVSENGTFTFGAQVPGYGTADAYVPGDLGTGPHCRGLPDATIPYPGVQLRDGYTHPRPNDLLPVLLGPDVVAGAGR